MERFSPDEAFTDSSRLLPLPSLFPSPSPPAVPSSARIPVHIYSVCVLISPLCNVAPPYCQPAAASSRHASSLFRRTTAGAGSPFVSFGVSGPEKTPQLACRVESQPTLHLSRPRGVCFSPPLYDRLCSRFSLVPPLSTTRSVSVVGLDAAACLLLLQGALEQSQQGAAWPREEEEGRHGKASFISKKRG